MSDASLKEAMVAALIMARLSVEKDLENLQLTDDHRSGYLTALFRWAEFARAIDMGAYQASAVLVGYRLLAGEIAAATTPDATSTERAADRINRTVAELRGRNADLEEPSVYGTALSVLCQMIDELRGLPPQAASPDPPPPPAPPVAKPCVLHLVDNKVALQLLEQTRLEGERLAPAAADRKVTVEILCPLCAAVVQVHKLCGVYSCGPDQAYTDLPDVYYQRTPLGHLRCIDQPKK